MIDLEAIEARAKAATPGPCRVYETSDAYAIGRSTDGRPAYGCHAEDIAHEADADFYAACHVDVPALIAEVRRLAAERDACLAACVQVDAVVEGFGEMFRDGPAHSTVKSAIALCTKGPTE